MIIKAILNVANYLTKCCSYGQPKQHFFKYFSTQPSDFEEILITNDVCQLLVADELMWVCQATNYSFRENSNVVKQCGCPLISQSQCSHWVPPFQCIYSQESVTSTIIFLTCPLKRPIPHYPCNLTPRLLLVSKHYNFPALFYEGDINLRRE